MNKKMKAILQNMQEKLDAAKTADSEKASQYMDEYNSLKAEYETQKSIFEAEKSLAAEGMQTNPLPEAPEEPEVTVKSITATDEYKKAFIKAVQTGNLHKLKNMFEEGTDEEGGYTVPEDINYKVQQYRTAKASLLDLVDVRSVSTDSGRDTYQKRSTIAGFVKVDEKGQIPAAATPKFEILRWAIKKYGGVFAATNESLADSAENLERLLIEWMGDYSRVTANKLIIEKFKTFTTATLTSAGIIDEIKKILNVTLGQAFKPTSRIITNDDGLQILDTLKDNDNNYLLTGSPDEPMTMRLCAGATTIPVVVIPNSDLPSETVKVENVDKTKVPFFIGDCKEAVRFYDRQKRSMLVSNTASFGDLNAFDSDLTLFRCLEREDVQKKDTQALIYASLTA